MVVLALSLFCHISHLVICVFFLVAYPFYFVKSNSWQVGLDLAVIFMRFKS